jgi:soluble lytic murein transglycosylase-like protein
MDALKLALAPLLLAMVSPAAADRVTRWQPYIAEASLRFGLPQGWIVRVMRAESGGATSLGGRPIRSPKGAMGLMQLMPGTWAHMRERLGLGTDPDDPRDNILAGTGYLRLMYDRFGYPGLFGAYSAGPERYAAWVAGRARLPAETIAYLGRVAPGAGAPAEAPPLAAPPILFAVRHEAPPPSPEAEPKPGGSLLFALRNDPR